MPDHTLLFAAPANATYYGFVETFDLPSGLPPTAYQLWGVSVIEDLGAPSGNAAVTSAFLLAQPTSDYLYFALDRFDVMPVGDADVDLYIRSGFGPLVYLTTAQAGVWTEILLNPILQVPQLDRIAGVVALDSSQQFYVDKIFVTVAALPEPSVWATMLIGFAAIGLAIRRRRNAALTLS